jgi:ribosome-binding protein aMBF1 (putative translation factor)
MEIAVVHPPQRPGWRAMSERIAELDHDPRRAKALAEARRKMAEELYPSHSLASLRLKKGLSQTELARRIGASQSWLSRIEAGTDIPSHPTVVKLAKALEADLQTVSDAIMEKIGAHHD